MFYTLENYKLGYEINLLQSNDNCGYTVEDERLTDLIHNRPAFINLFVINERISMNSDIIPSLVDLDFEYEYEAIGDTDVKLVKFMEKKDYEDLTNTLIIAPFVQTPQSSAELWKLLYDFRFDCSQRESGNQLLIITDRAELINNPIISTESIWLHDTIQGREEVYSLLDFEDVGRFEGERMTAYLNGRFGGL